MFLEGIAMLVERIEGVDLAGKAASGDEAIAVLDENPPDVVVLDFQLGDMTGLDVLTHITERELPVRVLFVSGRLEGDDAYRLVENGAYGLIEKDATFEEIADAIASVAKGERVMSKRVTAVVMAGVRARRDQPVVILSDREREILSGLSRGLSAPALAEEMEVSASSVKTYLQRLYDKLGVSDRAAAVAEALRRGLID